MKKLILIVIGALVISACANKDVYFNGSEGSHSGMKFDKDTRHWLCFPRLADAPFFLRLPAPAISSLSGGL